MWGTYSTLSRYAKYRTRMLCDPITESTHHLNDLKTNTIAMAARLSWFPELVSLSLYRTGEDFNNNVFRSSQIIFHSKEKIYIKTEVYAYPNLPKLIINPNFSCGITLLNIMNFVLLKFSKSIIIKQSF